MFIHLFRVDIENQTQQTEHKKNDLTDEQTTQIAKNSEPGDKKEYAGNADTKADGINGKRKEGFSKTVDCA